MRRPIQGCTNLSKRPLVRVVALMLALSSKSGVHGLSRLSNFQRLYRLERGTSWTGGKQSPITLRDQTVRRSVDSLGTLIRGDRIHGS